MINRRDFFLRTAATAGAAAFANFPYEAFAGTSRKYATDRIQLGPMKVDVSRLAQGSGTNGVGGSSNQTRKLGLKGLAELFDAAYDNGVTFWDCAEQKGKNNHVKEEQKREAREKAAT